MHRSKPWILTALLLLGVASTGRAQQESSNAVRVKLASEAVLRHYNKNSGLFDSTGWWNAANGITALADASKVLGRAGVHATTFDNTFQRAQGKFPDFLNDFYDDEGWWALAWLAVYDLDHKPIRLHMAESIFENMTGGWDGVCGGGIWWKKDRHYKNAIANELFLSVAARLAQRSTGQQKERYRKWAMDEWRWFAASGMINGQQLVNDGLDSSCRNNGKTEWSYNQGVVLTGLLDLADLEQDPELRAQASRMAQASAKALTGSDGVLHEVCEPGCGADGVQFKGIYVRNLADLDRRLPNGDLRGFLHRNANELWTRGRSVEGGFSTVWSGPPATANAGADIAALDLFVADGIP